MNNEIKLDFDDVLIKPNPSSIVSRNDINLYVNYKFKHSRQEFNGIPIIATNMFSVGTLECCKALASYQMITWLHKFYDITEIKKFYHHNMIGPLWELRYAQTIGENWHYDDILPAARFIRLDAANGYRQCFLDSIKRLRDRFQTKVIFAGNVCTPEGVENLINAGADVAVVGIGPGGHCTTRIKTGVGYPQLSAIQECYFAADLWKAHIVADGGCRSPGDIAKAFAAGADFVALGSMLAAHDENTAEENIITKVHGITLSPYRIGMTSEEMLESKKYAKVYGMASNTALEKHYKKGAEHRTSEGKTTEIEMRGSIHDTIKDILGGLRSCCSYVGIDNLQQLSSKATFIRVNQQRNTEYDKHTIGD
jgi:GMP reductase